jgi:pseudouridine synthase
MARAGVGSRRYCERLIAQGRVSMNGQVVTEPGTHADPDADRILVDGVPLGQQPVEKSYFLLHKPRGYITSTADPRRRRVVTDLLPPLEHPVYPVGRLDYDASGLLILTNDGDLAYGLTHPSREVPKTYLVEVVGEPGRAALTRLRRGVLLEDGPSGPARVRLVKSDGTTSTLSITIHEGRKHQVKRMCRAVGHGVLRLKRVRLGPLSLGRLGPGEWRTLTPVEVERLYGAASLRPALRGGKGVPASR